MKRRTCRRGYDLVLIPRPLDEYALEPIRQSLTKLAKQAVKKILKDAETAKPTGEAT